jgi:VCBS repeat-containing protein
MLRNRSILRRGFTAVGSSRSRVRPRKTSLRNRRLAYEPLEERTVLSVVLDGDVLDLGINDDGSLITAPWYANGVGANFHGVEFLTWGAPWALISVSANGEFLANTGPNPGSQMPLSVTDTSSGGTLSALVQGTVTTGLELQRTLSYATDQSVVRFTITLTNTASTAFQNVAFTEGIDPDQGWGLGDRYLTYNDLVLDGQFARSHTRTVQTPDGPVTLTIGIGSGDPRATTSVEFQAMDPFETIESPDDPGGALEDRHLHVAFDFGTLAPGDSVTAEYAMVVAASPEEADALFLGTLSPSNAPPVADDDSYAVDEDHTLTVAAPGVLFGDEDPDGDPLTAAVAADPSHGALTLNPNGSFTYTPHANFFGTDSFVYQVSDGQGGTDTATVTLTVNPVIDAVIDVKPGNENNRVKLHAAGVLPVAILSTSTADGEVEDFDAATLAALHMECFEFGDARTGYARVNPLRSTLEDVDGDGDLDLLLHFSMRDIVEAGALDADSVDVVLTARFGARAVGVQLAGYDAVEMVLPKPKGKKDK